MVVFTPTGQLPEFVRFVEWVTVDDMVRAGSCRGGVEHWMEDRRIQRTAINGRLFQRIGEIDGDGCVERFHNSGFRFACASRLAGYSFDGSVENFCDGGGYYELGSLPGVFFTNGRGAGWYGKVDWLPFHDGLDGGGSEFEDASGVGSTVGGLDDV